jgi:hypothetical protein
MNSSFKIDRKNRLSIDFPKAAAVNKTSQWNA